MLGRYAAPQAALFIALSLNHLSLIHRPAAADEGSALRPARFEGSLEPKLPKTPLADVVVKGNRQIKMAQVLALIKTKAGQIASSKQIREDTRSLLAQRWFSDVETRVDQTRAGAVLIFIVTEMPILAKITYAGNAQIDQKELTEFVEMSGVTVGCACEKESTLNAAGRIEEHYHASGYAHAKVSVTNGNKTDARKSDAGAFDERELVFLIDEGPKVIVASITLVGNNSYSTKDLKFLMKSTIAGSWLSDGTYRPHDVDHDVDFLLEFYRNRGFLDVQVTHRETFASDRSRVHLEFCIEEGRPYRVRHIEIKGNTNIDEKVLRAGMLLRPGDRYDRRVIFADQEKMRAQYLQLGYVFAMAIAHERMVAGAPQLVDLTYDIDEGDSISIESKVPAADRPKPNTVPAESPDIRDVERIKFIGVQSFEVADLRWALGVDFDYYRAAHPRGSLADFIDFLQRQVLAGYRHAGFPDASVAATRNSATGQVEVRVVEGRRFHCGEIKVNGVPQTLIESLVEGLTTDRRPNRILWRKGEAAPFDEFTLARMRQRIEAAFAAEAGLFSPQFEILLRRRPDNQMADLTVNIRDLGVRAIVGKIDIRGAKRHSTDDVLEYLDVQPGMPFDSRLTGRLQRRLWESGRYLREQVVAKIAAAPDGVGKRQVRDLEIKLREFKEAPPLKGELPQADQALLKLREWLEKWAQGDVEDDLVLTASTHTLKGIPNGRKTELQIVIAPNRGQTLVLDISGSDGQPILNVAFAAYANRFVLAAPQRHAKVVFPNSDGQKLRIWVGGDSDSTPFEDDGTKPFMTQFGFNVDGSSKLKASALGIQTRFSPAFMLSITHLETSRSEVRDGICTAWVGDARFQVDAASGRLIAFRLEDKTNGTIILIQTVKHGLKSELAKLEPAFAAAKVAYDESSPWKSLCEFALDCGIDAAGHEDVHDADSLRALRKLVGRWSPPAIGDLFDYLDDGKGTSEDGFVIPSTRVGFSLDDLEGPRSQSRRNLAAIFLPAYRRLVPRRSSLWLVGRDVALSWAAGDKFSNAWLAETCESPENGPIAQLLLGNLASLLAPDLSERAGIAGIRQLTSAAFRNEYKTILKGDSWLGQSLISLARAARTLDVAELNALGSLIPVDTPRELFVNSLRELKANPAQPVEAVLPAVLDRVWTEFLRAKVSAALREFVTNPAMERERLHFENQVRPASAEEPEQQRSN